VTPKQFRQVFANFGFLMGDEELQSLVKTYGDDKNDIKYLDFIKDANPVSSSAGMDSASATKTPYQG